MGGMVFGGKPDDAEDSQEESKKWAYFSTER